MEQVIIRAVAGVLKQDNLVLMASRPSGKVHAGSWEFPGGKLETGETAIMALIRELKEEIMVDVNPIHCQNLTFITQDYSHGRVELDVILVNSWQWIPTAIEGQKLLWQDITSPCQATPLLITTQKILDLLAACHSALAHPSGDGTIKLTEG